MIRSATLEDAPVIARVQLQAYRETYAGQWPQSYLESLSVGGQTEYWSERLRSSNPDKAYFVAELDGSIVGFSSGGKMNQADLEFTSELYTLYLLQSAQGRGLGKALFRAVTDFLIRGNYATMLCWVHSTNTKAQDFYRAMGGSKAREQMSSRIEGMLMYAYGWGDLGGSAHE